MKKILLKEAYDLLRETGIVSNESEFSEDWLGHSECYIRTLRFRDAEPSMGSLAICGVRLQKAGEQMLGTRRYKKLGIRFTEMSEEFLELVNMKGVVLELT